jgi:hypothetical protein
MKTFQVCLSMAVILMLVGCGEGTKGDSGTEPEVKTVAKEFHHEAGTLDATFKDARTAGIFKEYIAIKTALINTDAVTASTKAADLLKALGDETTDSAMVTASKKIATTDNIELQRAAFVGVTAAMEAMLKDQLENGAIYKQFCPMAFNNKGAYWLSESKEIANPFFGDKMYRCGRIDTVIE